MPYPVDLDNFNVDCKDISVSAQIVPKVKKKDHE